VSTTKALKLHLLAGSLLLSTGIAGAAELTHKEMNSKEDAKNSNVAAAQQLNGDSREAEAKEKAKDKQLKEEGKKPDKLGGESALSDSKNKADAKKTADVVNQVPGVKVNTTDLTPPTAAPIKGFHPIKKLLRPVENLEGMTIKLEQQIMKLEGPIAALQPPMIHLQKKMTGVDEQLHSMQGQLNGMQTEVTGVRTDIAGMRKDIQALKKPIVALKGPIGTVAKPLEKLQAQLNFIILAIIISAISIAIGTPVAAIVLYKYRHKLFPDVARDMPKVEAPPKPTSSRR
ncbi:MAG TPA: hypothetical protein V6C72_14900, partial [Chroococcales cyanobacterium]